METNVQVELQQAIAMKGRVEAFAITLRKRMNDLNGMIDQFVRAGFPSDIARTYRAKYFSPDNQIISDLSRKMGEDHVAFLKGVISDLKGATDLQ